MFLKFLTFLQCKTGYLKGSNVYTILAVLTAVCSESAVQQLHLVAAVKY